MSGNKKVNVEVTEQQRKMAEEWEKEQIRKQQMQAKQGEHREKIREECTKVAKFLMGLGMRTRRTQLIVAGEGGKKFPVNCEYTLGKDLHFQIMTNREKILKMIPTMTKGAELNGLESIQDSCKLVMGLIQFQTMNRVIPNRMQYQDPKDPECKKPKSVEILPLEHMMVTPHGFYIFQVEAGQGKTQMWLIAAIALAFFFLLFRVWPEWLKVGVWYISWYTLVFLVVMAIIRAIVWFVIFHIGIDFWIFPNYFIDSDNILDSFWPLLSVDKREDMFDVRMLLLRVASATAIFYGAQEFMKDPENLDSLLGGGSEIWDEMYDWGQNKFMGTVDPNQQIEVKKSARQIFSEAFMDDENPMFRTNTQFANYADEDALKEKYEEEQKLSAEERARAQFEDILADDEEEQANNSEAADNASTAEETKEDDEDILDKLTGNVDDEEEEAEREEARKAESSRKEAAAAAKAKQEATEKAAKAAEEVQAKAKAEAEVRKQAKTDAATQAKAEETKKNERLEKEKEQERAKQAAEQEAEAAKAKAAETAKRAAEVEANNAARAEKAKAKVDAQEQHKQEKATKQSKSSGSSS